MKRTIFLLVLFIVLMCGSGFIGIIIYKKLTGASKSEHLLSVEKIENLGKMELVKVNIKDVVEQTKERPLFLPNAKAILIIAGEVFAGIDFEKVKREDIVDSGTQVTVTLPKPEILLSKVKNAELIVIEEAGKTGYEETCKNNARALLTPMFRELSGKEVEILFKD